LLGQRLSHLRKKAKMRQVDIANNIGIARTTYAMYEQDKREPDFETLQKIADIFEVSIDYLLGRTDAPTPGKYEENENLFFFDLEGLSDEDIEAVKKHIESLRLMAKQYNKNFKEDK
jgi:transcriptional regulator with XRE-family HTH domain